MSGCGKPPAWGSATSASPASASAASTRRTNCGCSSGRRSRRHRRRGRAADAARPAASPCSGPWPSRASSTTVMAAGNGGSSWPVRADHDDRPVDRAGDDAGHAPQQRLPVPFERRLRAPHARRAPAGEHDACGVGHAGDASGGRRRYFSLASAWVKTALQDAGSPLSTRTPGTCPGSSPRRRRSCGTCRPRPTSAGAAARHTAGGRGAGSVRPSGPALEPRALQELVDRPRPSARLGLGVRGAAPGERERDDDRRDDRFPGHHQPAMVEGAARPVTTRQVRADHRGRRGAQRGRGPAASVAAIPADHFSSMRPKRQTASATTQVRTNSATIA